MADLLFGFHSESQEALYGHWLYTTPAGNRVRVTLVRDSELIEQPRAHWPDIRYIGPIVYCLGMVAGPGQSFAHAARIFISSGYKSGEGGR